jgi:hypothetical protein
MKRPSTVVLLLMVLGSAALAEPSAKDALAPLKGRFAFNWRNSPAKEKCIRITDKLLKDFERNYQCDLQENSSTASGKPSVRCTRNDDSKQYLVFKTKELCEEERETQMANSED